MTHRHRIPAVCLAVSALMLAVSTSHAASRKDVTKKTRAVLRLVHDIRPEPRTQKDVETSIKRLRAAERVLPRLLSKIKRLGERPKRKKLREDTITTYRSKLIAQIRKTRTWSERARKHVERRKRSVSEARAARHDIKQAQRETKALEALLTGLDKALAAVVKKWNQKLKRARDVRKSAHSRFKSASSRALGKARQLGTAAKQLKRLRARQRAQLSKKGGKRKRSRSMARRIKQRKNQIRRILGELKILSASTTVALHAFGVVDEVMEQVEIAYSLWRSE